MNNTYDGLVQQTFNFPQEDFKLKDEYLQYNDVDIKALIDKYGTPLKLSYLPKIGMQIEKAKKLFANAFKKHKYEGEYHYCYCTKSSHFNCARFRFSIWKIRCSSWTNGCNNSIQARRNRWRPACSLCKWCIGSTCKPYRTSSAFCAMWFR